MKYLCVLPWIDKPVRDRCVQTCKFDLFEVDNSVENRGIMRSNNLGIDKMRDEDADWFVLMSAAVRFGPSGGLDFIAALEHCASHAVVTAEGLFGWHLIAFARETVELAGRFDETFYPYGWDDVDYAIRIHKSRPGAIWSGIKCIDASDRAVGMAHSIHRAGVTVDNEHHLDYFARKWGGRPEGQPFEWFFDHPFNDPVNPVGYWPEDPAFTRGGRWNERCS